MRLRRIRKTATTQMQMRATHPTTAPMMAGVLFGESGVGGGVEVELEPALVVSMLLPVAEEEVVVVKRDWVAVWVVEVLEVEVGVWEVAVPSGCTAVGMGFGEADETEDCLVLVVKALYSSVLALSAHPR